MAICPVEVRLNSEKEHRARDRLGVHMYNLFSNQATRMFAFGLTISQSTLTICLFDRAGIIYSPLDYHKYPDQFCAVILGLYSLNPEEIGQDPDIFMQSESIKTLRTVKISGKKTEVIHYTVGDPIYVSDDMFGRATNCYCVERRTNPGITYVVKDTWSSLMEGKESEGALLAHIKSCGIQSGIPVVHHFEELSVENDNGMHPDSILFNRKISSPDDNLLEDKRHTRMVMSPFGKTLTFFSSKRELLFAYRYALQAHRDLYEVAGILHRNIKPANILIVWNGDDIRGVLIDLIIYSVYPTHLLSLRLKVECNALRKHRAHSCIDDLESFYYVLVYICAARVGPGKILSPLPDFLQTWKTPTGGYHKFDFIGTPFKWKVQPWFGAIFETLVSQFHAILCNHRRAQKLAVRNKGELPILVASNVYSQMLSYLNEAIISNEKNEPQDYLVELSTARKRPLSRRNKLITTTVAGNRSLRKGVNYGRRA
ncbi:hypothetical protein M422DRAFT_69713 [Sphaerobolus stellatus SS14]|uniref:Fungal-type protein kinase domain-containing protein n=1 Tax=Sphaerobolus stellatus (strain SS14) TaxID=990650 RepID=A0A0C9UNI9_SPHS4|nr:hypothetical protein M422DRAFT_69713 [Sphaerobolus stellatus SS14]